MEWHEGDQMEVQWDDDDDELEEMLERRRVDGDPLQAEATKNVPELVAHDRIAKD